MEYLNLITQFGVIAGAVGVGGALIPLLRTVFEKALGFKFEKQMEEFRYGVRIREQAAKTAEYLATGWRLDKDDQAGFVRANQLSWELALYLPADVYRHVRDAIASPSEGRNVCTAVIAARRYLLGHEAGDLDAEEIAFHAPDANRRTSTAANDLPISS